jgi:hypothetical protein
MEITDWNILAFLSKARLSQDVSSGNSQFPNYFPCRSMVRSFVEIGQEIWKVRAEIHLHPSSEVWLSLSRCARTSGSFDTFYKELLYRISGKSHTWFSSTYYVKDRRTDGRATSLPSRRKERVIMI